PPLVLFKRLDCLLGLERHPFELSRSNEKADAADDEQRDCYDQDRLPQTQRRRQRCTHRGAQHQDRGVSQKSGNGENDQRRLYGIEFVSDFLPGERYLVANELPRIRGELRKQFTDRLSGYFERPRSFSFLNSSTGFHCCTFLSSGQALRFVVLLG